MSRIRNCFFLLVLLLLWCSSATAQMNRDSLRLFSLCSKADSFYNAGSYESAFDIYNNAYLLCRSKRFMNYSTASAILLHMGHCFYKRSNFQKAHDFYFQALANARKYQHHRQFKQLALKWLHSVQINVVNRDIEFNYPGVTNLSEEVVCFTINKVLFRSDDSVVISIAAGRYDGVVPEKNFEAEIMSLVDPKARNAVKYIASAKLTSVTNNRSYAVVRGTELSDVVEGCQIKLIANTPARVLESEIRSSYLYNFRWKDINGEEWLFNRRYFYYYADDDLRTDIMDLLKSDMLKVVELFSADTLKQGDKFKYVVTDGIFTGKNIFRALAESTGKNINYFLRYISDFPKSFSGNLTYFSESYANWCLANAPLSEADVKAFILEDEKDPDKMMARVRLISKQILNSNITDKWIDEGLEFADKNWWYSLNSQASLLFYTGVATKRKDLAGWCNFFQGVVKHAYGKTGEKNAFLNRALSDFNEYGSAEGIQWINSVKSALPDTPRIEMHVQSAHTLGFTIYPSPNQRYFATAGQDYNIKIWDIQLNKQIQTIDAHDDEISSMAYNPGGRYLASVANDSMIKIWNTYNYHLMNAFKPLYPQHKIAFTPDGKSLVSCGSDSSINYWDPFSGKLIKSLRYQFGRITDFYFYPVNKQYLYVVASDSCLLTYDHESGKFEKVAKFKEIPISLLMTKDGRYCSVIFNNSNFNVIDLERREYIVHQRLHSWEFLGRQFFADPAFSPDSKYLFYTGADSATYIVNLKLRQQLPFYGYPKQIAFNENGSYFLKVDVGMPVIVDFSAFDWEKIYTVYKGQNSRQEYMPFYFMFNGKKFRVGVAASFHPRFSPDKRTLYFTSYGMHALDLTTGKFDMLHYNHSWTSKVQYPSALNLVPHRGTRTVDSLLLYDHQQKKDVATFILPDKDTLTTFCFGADDNICVAGTSTGGIVAFETLTGKIIYNIKKLNNSNNPITSLQTQPGTNIVIATQKKAVPVSIQLETGKLLHHFKVGNISNSAVTKSQLFFINDSSQIFAVNTSDQSIRQLKYTAFGPSINQMVVSKSGNYLYILDEPYCTVFSTNSLEEVNKFKIHLRNLADIAVSDDDSLLITGSMTSELAIYNPLSSKSISRIYLPYADDGIVADTLGHYIASKKAVQAVVFKLGNKSLSYEQFDLQLNQPHTVLRSIGVADSATIQAYEKAYVKRLSRRGIKAASLELSNLPNVIILNKGKIRPTTTNQYLTITAECFDVKNKITSVKVVVNEVPVFDSAGLRSNLDTSSAVFDITIKLTPGINRVSVFCTNNQGLSSFKESFDVHYLGKQTRVKTWFIGLGVNEYADATHNLVYSVKDIRDLASAFKEVYPDLIVDTLMNKQVTRKNIHLLKKRLRQISSDDRVIMAVTGHGVLNDSLDFYYATYDMNFARPEDKGFKYQDLEDLLSETQARQKLLLIDACNSGIIDKESVTITNRLPEAAGVVKAKGTRGLVADSDEKKMDDSHIFALMQSLFADLSNETGVVVISAAGGLEYAFESSEWQNGVFTYTVLKALKEMTPDLHIQGGNGDGKVSIQELLRYVSAKVPQLTNGKQQPTSRRENLEYDWIIKDRIKGRLID